MKYPIGIQDFKKIRKEGFAFYDLESERTLSSKLLTTSTSQNVNQMEVQKKLFNNQKQKNYAAPFAMNKRKVITLGINFSSKTRGVESWNELCRQQQR